MSRYDVAVIGGGPGGYVAAIRAGQLGLRTVLIERDRVGGVCLNWGCIPSKSLLHAADIANAVSDGARFGVHVDGLRLDLGEAVDESRRAVERLVRGVESLLRHHGVEVMGGSARLTAPDRVAIDAAGATIEADHVVVATGARARSLPGVPVDGHRVLTSREALDLRTVPASILIAGGGAIGVEFAYLFRSFGSEVTLVELLPRLLPGEDDEIGPALERALRGQGIDVRTGTSVERVEISPDGIEAILGGAAEQERLGAERLLVGAGVEPNTRDLGLEAIGVGLADGYIAIDDHCRTSAPSVFAIGDVTGKLPLAHAASAQGIAAIETIAGVPTAPLDYATMPRAVFCQPQVGAVGLTERDARARGFDVAIGRFPLRASGRAIAIGGPDGFVKLVVDRTTDEVIGYHVIGRDATELLGEFALGRLLEATATEIGYAVHAHPTLAEAVQDAARALHAGAIHFAGAARGEAEREPDGARR